MVVLVAPGVQALDAEPHHAVADRARRMEQHTHRTETFVTSETDAVDARGMGLPERTAPSDVALETAADAGTWIIDHMRVPMAVAGDGQQPMQLLVVMDGDSHEILAQQVVPESTPAAVVAVLKAAADARAGAPGTIHVDHGHDVSAKSVHEWAASHNVRVVRSPSNRPVAKGAIEGAMRRLAAGQG
jgi:transposase InsO family protein